MKRTVIILSLIFALAIALSVSIPTLALDGTDTTTVTGSVPLTITVTAPATVALETLTIDTPKESAAQTVTVACNKAGWTLTAIEDGVTPDGKMNAGSDILTNVCQIKGGDQATYVGLDAARTLETSGSKGTTPISTIYFAQTATAADTAGDYSITVLFTGTIN
ncbi:MAG: hypothetical protein WC455_05235 [Dehalococcoidia bacterium]|jgi:hypothetical protein